MKVTVPHNTTVEEAIQIVDRSADGLFAGVVGGAVELADRKQQWNGPRMGFSLTARLGFIELPISGTVVIDDLNVTVNCDLPPLVTTFVGEDKIRAGVERKVRGMLQR
ncbi:MAG TPA: hypothetical protein VG297_06810 [Bryobacteraceae bacterium]|nr:hypothetical protein [Bryobacteraceae bacterium]